MTEQHALAGKVAFVTGGSKGIGRAIALGLAKAGAAVALTGRSAGEGEGTAAARLIAAEAGRALPLVCDVRDAGGVQAAVDRAVGHIGRLDILVNNAGLYFPGVDAI